MMKNILSDFICTKNFIFNSICHITRSWIYITHYTWNLQTSCWTISSVNWIYTLRLIQNGHHFADYSWCSFLLMEFIILRLRFHCNMFPWVSDDGSDTGLALNRQQAIIWNSHLNHSAPLSIRASIPQIHCCSASWLRNRNKYEFTIAVELGTVVTNCSRSTKKLSEQKILAATIHN